MKKTLLALSTISALTSASEVYFIEPTDGDKFNGNVKVVFGLSGDMILALLFANEKIPFCPPPCILFIIKNQKNIIKSHGEN